MRCLLVLALVVACAAPVRAADDAESRARAHYEIGLGLYRLGDYRGALKEFAAGYELARKPGFLLNIAQSYRQLGDLPRARAQYRQFLADAPPDDRSRAETEQILVEIDAELRAHPPSPEPPLDPAPAPPAPDGASVRASDGAHDRLAARQRARRGLRVAGLTIGAVGLASLACGGAFAVVADQTARDLNRTDATGGVYDPGKDLAYKTDRLAEAVTLGAGASLAAVGLVVYLVGRR
jgi:tetratricopeptide (TPR) repeat protein